MSQTNKPTKEQEKELWEWCRPKEQGQPFTMHYPPIDLNNLFKYAVPLALERLTKLGHVSPALMKLFQLWYDELVAQTGDSGKVEDPALALFWALYKVMEEK